MLTDELINRVTFKIPNALVLVGSRAGDEWNGMTTSWVTQVAMEPVLVAICVDTKAVTRRLIEDAGAFTVNLWDREDTRPFVKFSKPATYEDGALNGRPVRTGATGTPIFEEAVAYLDCRVWQQMDCGTHQLFLGEVDPHDVEQARPAARASVRRMMASIDAPDLVVFTSALAARFFAEGFFPHHEATPHVIRAGLASPFAATFAVPLDVEISVSERTSQVVGDVPLLLSYGVHILSRDTLAASPAA